MSYHIQPAAKRLCIAKRIGWYTFRRTYTTLLHANGEDVKVVQELLRHGSSPDHDGRVRASVDTGEAQGAGESRGDAAGHQEGREVRLTVVCPRCVPAEKWGFQQVDCFVGVPDGI